MVWKQAARVVLHDFGGLAVLRRKHRGEFRILMFHSFPRSAGDNLETICAHIARHFEPVPLSRMIQALEGGASLPASAITVTVDDGYKDFLEHGQPMLRRYRIPATVYAVSGFSDGRLWLWFDRLEYALQHTAKTTVRASLGGKTLEFRLGSAAEKMRALEVLTEELKLVPNLRRQEFIDGLAGWCQVDIPAAPPPERAAMSWDDLRAVAAEGVEIGCHTATHPILSRVSDAEELEREIGGSKALMEERLRFAVKHFCYPNGRDIDIGEAAERAVRAAGFASAVTTTWGLNSSGADPLRLRRVPFDSALDPRYGAELLAGLHM